MLSAGDVVLVPHRGAYTLADHPESPTVDIDLPDSEEGRLDGDEPDDPHGAVTETLCAAYFLDRGHGHPLLRDLPPVIHLPAAAGERTSLRQAVDLLVGELSSERHVTSAIVPALIDALLLLILREWIENEATRAHWAVAFRDPTVLAALQAIHSHPEQAWTVESLARECGSSRAAFAARFKAVVGMPPLTYLRWWRMTNASQQLRTTSTTIGAVARRAGYTSEFAFSKAFKREFGLSPKGYRLQRLGEPREHLDWAGKAAATNLLPAASGGR
jgi:AraC-like DNA-binding protein